MEKATISVAFVEGMLEGVRAKGLSVEELLEQVGLSSVLLSHPHARVSATTYTMLMRLIVQLLDDEVFGQDSRRMKVGSFAMLCRNVIHCPTLDKAMIQTVRFFDLMLDDLTLTVRRDGGGGRVVLRDVDAALPVRLFAHETLMMFIHRLACWLVNRRIPIEQVAFRHPRPAHAEEYEQMFCGEMSFDQPQSHFAIAERYFDLPVVRSEAELKEFLTIAPGNLLIQYKNSQSLAAQITRRLRVMPPEDWPGFEEMAESLNLSPSTLRRRLEAEDKSFQAIKDLLRRDMAINLLSDTRKSVMEIAADLGFAETSAFHRAFKKWTGANPGEYRRSSRPYCPPISHTSPSDPSL